MHQAAGQKDFFKAHVDEIAAHLSTPSPDVLAHVSAAFNLQGDESESKRAELAKHFAEASSTIQGEEPQPYTHYVSRFPIVGIVQSALAVTFQDIPALQGYGGGNALWVTTKVEQLGFTIKNFFHDIHEGAKGREPLMVTFLKAWKDLKHERADYPVNTPQTVQIPSTTVVALLADWGGDNPAARNVSDTVRKSPSRYAIHLGDIYYGGSKRECESFLQLWPYQNDVLHPLTGVAPGTSFALNGNHEMYTGGESFFRDVLPAFGQPMPYFCLENDDWRIIGLDTAYDYGRLKGPDQSPGIAAQWDWLVALLRKNDGKANIILSHHQPVSAHAGEYKDSQGLRDDVEALLKTEGVREDAIFAWFFGHEHRCAIYDDKATHFNARLIGSGCIPHEVQKETASEPGCTAANFFNARGEKGTDTAISMYAELRFFGPDLVIVYTDEDGMCWGSETWYKARGRLNGSGFIEGDGLQRLPLVSTPA